MKNKILKIEMKNQLEEALDMIGEEVNGRVSSPANTKIFDVDKNAVKLTGKQADLFHSVVAKLKYGCTRSRPDIDTVVAFLCTRVSKSDAYDCQKLFRLLGFIKRQ